MSFSRSDHGSITLVTTVKPPVNPESDPRVRAVFDDIPRTIRCTGLPSASLNSNLGVMQRSDIATGIFTVDRFIDQQECSEFIIRAESGMFEAAPIISATGIKVEAQTRNNDRQIWDDFSLAEKLWSRAVPHVPATLAGRQPIGLNERFRLYRYVPGQRFTWHADAPFRRSTGEISLLTFMIYLNDEYEGGATRFESAKVLGRAGMALFFQHGLVHEGAEVTSGVKYVLRSDVMFSAEPQNGA